MYVHYTFQGFGKKRCDGLLYTQNRDNLPGGSEKNH
jgi:hypothetical protein